MQPGKRLFTSSSKSFGAIQLPSEVENMFFRFTFVLGDLKPDFGSGIVSKRLAVEITVLNSTRATSCGSVDANQL